MPERTRTGWTRAHARHAAAFLLQGRNPAARVYESLGPDFFLAPAPGWLNLGLWEGPGTEAEAPFAVRRLVERIAEALPKGGVVLDVGNGLGAQDPVIAEIAHPRRLVALNITRAQLVAGRERLRDAGAWGVAGDATHIPLADGSVDGVISVEAAFHFASRRRFFEEVLRVLRPGGVLGMSDVSTERLPRGPVELQAGLTQLRVWGLRSTAAQTADAIAATARAAGLADVEIQRCGERVIEPALRLTRTRLPTLANVPASQRFIAGVMLRQVELLWRRRVIDYVLLRARKPDA